LSPGFGRSHVRVVDDELEHLFSVVDLFENVDAKGLATRGKGENVAENGKRGNSTTDGS